jgi:hypothetical protein
VHRRTPVVRLHHVFRSSLIAPLEGLVPADHGAFALAEQ